MIINLLMRMSRQLILLKTNEQLASDMLHRYKNGDI